MDGFASFLRISSSALVIFVSFFIMLKNKKKDFPTFALNFGTLITLNLLINSFSWQHHFVWLIIPFYITFFYLRKLKKGKFYYLVIGVSYLLVSINFKNPDILPVIFQSHVFFGAIILLILNLHLFKRI